MNNAKRKIEQQREMDQRRKKERRLLAIVAIGLVAVVIVGGILFQAWRTNRTPTATAPSGPVSFAPVTITNGKPIVLGQQGAPVTISLYEDFHCPHCAEFEEQFGPTITEAQESGQAAVELFPMAFIDEGSAAAANGMACAAEAGFGQAYYGGLFANHTLQWSDQQLLDLAKQVGGKPDADFQACVVNKKHAAWVESISGAAQDAGVESTPTVFINGDPVEFKSLTPESLKDMIAGAANK